MLYKSGATNRVTDALSRRATLLTTLSVEVVGFEQIRDHYAGDEHFGHIWADYLMNRPIGEFVVQESYLFRNNRLCIPQSSLRDKFILRPICQA